MFDPPDPKWEAHVLRLIFAAKEAKAAARSEGVEDRSAAKRSRLSVLPSLSLGASVPLGNSGAPLPGAAPAASSGSRVGTEINSSSVRVAKSPRRARAKKRSRTQPPPGISEETPEQRLAEFSAIEQRTRPSCSSGRLFENTRVVSDTHD